MFFTVGCAFIYRDSMTNTIQELCIQEIHEFQVGQCDMPEEGSGVRVMHKLALAGAFYLFTTVVALCMLSILQSLQNIILCWSYFLYVALKAF